MVEGSQEPLISNQFKLMNDKYGHKYLKYDFIKLLYFSIISKFLFDDCLNSKVLKI